MPLYPLNPTLPTYQTPLRGKLPVYPLGVSSPSGVTGSRRISSTWRNLDIETWHELTATLDPLPLTIVSIPEPITSVPSNLDIEITSEHSNKEISSPPVPLHKPNPSPSPLLSTMEVEMSTTLDVKIKVGLPEDFTRKGEDAMRWILAMKAYFLMNGTQYTDMTKLLVTLNKMSKGRGAIFAKDGTWKSVILPFPMRKKCLTNWRRPSWKPLSPRILQTMLDNPFTPSPWKDITKGTSTSIPPS